MPRRNRSLPWLGCGAFALSFACSDEKLPLYEQDGVRYFANADDPKVCPHAAEDVANYRDALLDAYPLEEPPRIIDYFKYRYFSELTNHGPCSLGTECAVDFTVHSVKPLHRHEVAHATSETIFRSGGPLSEGYATGLSCGHGGRAIAPDAEVFFRYEEEIGIAHEYHLAGALVVELLRRSDTSALREAHKLFWKKANAPEKSAGQNREALNLALLEVYGASLDEVMATLRQPDVPSCLPVGRCDGPPLEPGLNVLETACGSHTEFILEADFPSPVGIVADGLTQLFSCEAGPNHYPPRENSFGTRPLGEEVGVYRDYIERILPPPPVRHLLGFSIERGHSRAAVAMRPLPGAYLASCPDQDVESIDFSVAFGSAISVPTAKGGYWFVYDFSGSGRAGVSDILSTWTTGMAEYLKAPDGLDAYICDHCSEAPEEECQRIAMVEQEPTEPFWEAMGGASSSAEGIPNDEKSTSKGEEQELFARLEASERAYIYLLVESVPERATYLEFAPRFLPEPLE